MGCIRQRAQNGREKDGALGLERFENSLASRDPGSLDRRPQNRCDSVIVDAAILSVRMVPSSVEGAWAIMSLCSTPYKLSRVEGRDSRVDVQPCGFCGVRLKFV